MCQLFTLASLPGYEVILNIPEALQAVTGQATEYISHGPVQMTKLQVFQRVSRRHSRCIQLQSSQRVKTGMSMRGHGKLQTADELVHSMGL